VVGDGHPLVAERLQQARPGLTIEDGGELPGQVEVEAVLDRGVGAPPVHRLVAVGGVADDEHPTDHVVGHVHVVDRPERHRLDLDGDGIVADQLMGDPHTQLVRQLGGALGGVVPPRGQETVVGLDHPDHAEAHAGVTCAGLDDPEHVGGAVGHEARQVRPEDDVEVAALAHLPLHREFQLLGHARAGALGADQVAGADVEFGAGQPVAQPRGHAVGVLGQALELGVG